jgi:hypothetical protein
MGPRGARKRLRGDGQVSPIGDIEVECNGAKHVVHVSGKLKIVALNHPAVSPKALAMEALIGGPTHGGCSAVVAALVGSRGAAQLPVWVYRIVEARQAYRETKREKNWLTPSDLLVNPLPHRTTLIREKAKRLLEQLHFRTTKTGVSHRVVLEETWDRPSAAGTSEKANAPRDSKKRKRAFADLRQVVIVRLNPKMWARACRTCGPVIDQRFVLRITQVWSENDLEVEMVKQSTGYKVTTARHRVRRGGDKIWRIHK